MSSGFQVVSVSSERAEKMALLNVIAYSQFYIMCQQEGRGIYVDFCFFTDS